MKPEDLRVIAKGMHPNEQIDIEEDEVWLMNYPSTTPEGRGYKILATQFNPLADDAQCMEIMEKLKIFISRHSRGGEDLVGASTFMYGREAHANGKTINEAVCKAALEYFKEAK